MSAALCLIVATMGADPCGSGYYSEGYYWGGPVYSYEMGPPSGYSYAEPRRGYRRYESRNDRDSARGDTRERRSGYRAPERRGNVVNMTNRGFEPAHITVNVGDTVEWRNTSTKVHTVTADSSKASNPAHVVLPEDAEPFDSGEVRQRETFTHTFDVPGIYYYVCQPHEQMGMVGIVVVREKPGAERAPVDAQREADDEAAGETQTEAPPEPQVEEEGEAPPQPQAEGQEEAPAEPEGESEAPPEPEGQEEAPPQPEG